MQLRNLCKSKASHGELLGVCDKVRDDTLPQLGVRLEDRPDGKHNGWLYLLMLTVDDSDDGCVVCRYDLVLQALPCW